MSWNQSIFVGHCTVEGLATARGIQGCLADALLDILRYCRIEHVFKWVDDIVCTLFVHRSAGSSVQIGSKEVFFCSSFLRSQCLLFCVFPFLKKEGTQMGNLCTWTQIKQLSYSLVDAPKEVPEDIQLMRGPCGSERWSKSLTCFERV